jgi:hypothetical protein
MMMRSLSCAFSPDVEKFAEPVRNTSPSMLYAFRCKKGPPRLRRTLSDRSPSFAKSWRSQHNADHDPAPLGGVERVDHDRVGERVAREVVDRVEALLGAVVDFLPECARAGTQERGER